MSKAHLALLIAGLTVFQALPVNTAQVAAHSLQRDPLADVELKVLSVDPVAFASDFFIPKGNLFIPGRLNYECVLAMGLVVALAAGAMYTDFLQFAEEERLKQKVEKVGAASAKTEESYLSTSRSNQSWPMLPSALVIVVLSMFAAAIKSAFDHADVPWPPHAPRSQATIPILVQHPMGNLHHLPGMDCPQDTLGDDALTVAFILVSMLIGFLMMRADLDEMVEEDKCRTSGTSRTLKDVAVPPSKPSAPSACSRQSSNCLSMLSFRTFVYIAAAVMVLLAMIIDVEQKSQGLSSYDLKELIGVKAFAYEEDKWHGRGLPDGIVAVIIFIVAAIGGEVFHYSDLLDMKEEEEEKERHQQAEKNTKTASAERPRKTK